MRPRVPLGLQRCSDALKGAGREARNRPARDGPMRLAATRGCSGRPRHDLGRAVAAGVQRRRRSAVGCHQSARAPSARHVPCADRVLRRWPVPAARWRRRLASRGCGPGAHQWAGGGGPGVLCARPAAWSSPVRPRRCGVAAFVVVALCGGGSPVEADARGRSAADMVTSSEHTPRPSHGAPRQNGGRTAAEATWPTALMSHARAPRVTPWRGAPISCPASNPVPLRRSVACACGTADRLPSPTLRRCLRCGGACAARVGWPVVPHTAGVPSSAPRSFPCSSAREVVPSPWV